MRLAQLSGTHAEGTLQFAATAINELMARSRPGHAHPVLELHPDNEVLLRYGLVHAHARVPRMVELNGAPHVTLLLRSLLVALALRAVVHQPYIHIHGRHVTIDLAAVPALAPWREMWRHLRQVEIETSPEALRVRFAVAVADTEE